MTGVKEIVSDINNGKFYPVYLLTGDETYYIDKISDYIEDNVLSEEEKGFNQTVMYGRDIDIAQIVDAAKRYPMMAERQVVIVKEAQDLARTIDQLTDYVKNPMPSTLLVLCYKHKKLDKRKAIYKAIRKGGYVLESNKLYENQVPEWIFQVLKGRNYKIENKAVLMLVEFLGTDLGKIWNELDKLMIVLPKGSTISAKDIEDNIGVSKDYNIFELRKAIGDRNVLKANQIVNYFGMNQKTHHITMTIAALNSFYTQLLVFHSLQDKSKNNVARMLKVNPFFADDYIKAGKNIPMRKVSQNIGHLREADVKSKGVGASNLPAIDILKELVFKMMH